MNNIEGGFIVLFRKFNKWEWKTDPNMVALFIHLLTNANHTDNKWQGIVVKRGQLVAGRKKLSQETGISEQTLRTCLNRLKSTKEITIKSTNKFSIITVCNYSKYQDKPEDNQSTNQPTNQPTTNQQLTTNNNENKENKEEREGVNKVTNEKTKQRGYSREFIPPTLEEVHEETVMKGYTGLDHEKFWAYYDSTGWIKSNGAKITNWRSALLLWFRKEPEFRLSKAADKGSGGNGINPDDYKDLVIVENNYAH